MAEDRTTDRRDALAGRAAARYRRADRTGATALIGCGALAVAILVTAAAATYVTHPVDPGPGVPASVAVANGPPPVYPVPAAAAPAAPAPAAIPTGAGVVAGEAAGRPQLSVYFATAKADVVPDFATAAAPLKTWLDGHAGARLAVSGFNDPRGDAAMNAALAKHRAQNVAAALAALGVPAAAIDLVKPAETTDTAASQAGARRVDIHLVDAPPQ